MLNEEERSLASALLDAVWSSNDTHIHNFIHKQSNTDHRAFDIPVSFYCVVQEKKFCDNCISVGEINCRHKEKRACICADELEYLPLDVLDLASHHRISLNLHLGMCPHVFMLLKDPSLPLDEEFCQKRIEEWYEIMELDSRATEIRSLFGCSIMNDFLRRSTICVTGAYLENFLFRLDKIEGIQKHYKEYYDRIISLNLSRFYRYGLLEMTILADRSDVFMDLLQQKEMQRHILTKFFHTSYVPIFEQISFIHLALEKDDLESFKAVLKMMKKYTKKREMCNFRIELHLALCKCLRACKLNFIKALLKYSVFWVNQKNVFWDLQNKDSSLVKCIERGREDIVYLLMTHPVFKHAVQAVLCLSIIHDQMQIIENVLHWFSKKGLHKAKFQLDLYTLAVLHNMPHVIKILDHYHVPETPSVKLSAMDFAKCLGYTQCMESLSESNHTCLGYSMNISPLLEVQHLQENTEHDFIIPVYFYMDALIGSGCFVNFEDPNGITAVQLAIKRRDYRSVRVLLMNGANLFQGQTFIIEKGTVRLLFEIFYCNINTYNNLMKIDRIATSRMLIQYGRCQNLNRSVMYFIFHSLHSISPVDEAHLIQTFPQDWQGVKSLQVTCRNVLRRHYGRHIHMFVQRFVNPKAIKRLLLLTDLTDQLQSQLKW